MQRPYTIFAARTEETTEGWIWFKEPQLPTRTVVKVRNPQTGRVVFCESRVIDSNFLKEYNKKPRLEIKVPEQALVIGQWYRNALGGFETTYQSGALVSLEIARAKLPWLGSLRASCHHPDIVARVGTRLGVLGAWLGLIGLIPVALDLFDVRVGCKRNILIAIALGGAIFAILACRGAKPPCNGK